MDHIYTLGIDIGSTASKCVMLADGKEIVAKSLISVGAGTSGPQRAISEVLEQAGKSKDEMAFVLATGYGRNSLEEIADAQMSELSCHAKGATFLFPQVHTVVDIGGQDVKILQVENGVMTNFVMNDKCAAGTGRFLEMMAKTLGLSLEEMSVKGLEWKHNIVISSMCTVFAESEVVSLVAQNKDVADIIHGLNVSVASKVGALAARLGKDHPGEYMMTGGVAKNQGIIQALEEKLGAKLYICDEAQLCGALGAALFAYEKCKGSAEETR
mgnify:CR=1 FL=1